MCAPAAVPVALDRLGVQGGRDVEVLGDAVEQPAGDPHVVGDLQRADRADLELPLAGHDLGVDAGDLQPGVQTGVQVPLDDLAAEHLVGADAAVVEALRGGEAALGEAERAAVLEEGVLLLDAVPGLLVREPLGDRAELGAVVGRVRRAVDEEDLAEHQPVVATAQRVRAAEDRLEHAVGVVAGGLVGAGAVEAPVRQVGAVLEDPGLGPEPCGGLGAVDPDVLGLVAQHRSLRHPGRRRSSGITRVAMGHFLPVAHM